MLLFTPILAHPLRRLPISPAKFAIEIELVPTSKDSRWLIGPDHEHATLKPGESKDITFQVKRAPG